MHNSYYGSFLFADKPENVQLNVNITGNKTCLGIKVNFTCTSDANPAVDNYTLYQNDVMIGSVSRSGVWIMPLNTSGQVLYRCKANNSVGTGISGDTNFAVEGEVLCSFFVCCLVCLFAFPYVFFLGVTVVLTVRRYFYVHEVRDNALTPRPPLK